jgi:hypothetical protein
VIFKLWLWVFEFRFKRTRDDKRIEFLAKRLLRELESQGYTLSGCPGGTKKYVNLYVYQDDTLHVDNIQNGWFVHCGNY